MKFWIFLTWAKMGPFKRSPLVAQTQLPGNISGSQFKGRLGKLATKL